MKNLIYLFTVVILLSSALLAQVKTDEKKMVINKVTGDTTYTESVIISESEDITPRNSMITINVLKFFFFYNISYYHKVSESVVIGAGMQTPTFGGMSGLGLNVEVRLHPKGKNMRGFYVAPNVSYTSIKFDNSSATNIYSIGGLFGWQWFPGDDFAMGLGLGVDYYFGSHDNSSSEFDGTAPALRFDIGYAW